MVGKLKNFRGGIVLAEYKYIEDEPKEIVKPVTNVRFKVDFDITNILTRFGNWSRRGIYLRQNTPSYYQSQPKKLREVCSDNDAMLIDKAFLSILALNIAQSKNIYNILMLYYFGEKQVITDYASTSGRVRSEWKRLAQDVHGAPNFKQLSRKIREDKIYLIKPLSVQSIADRMQTNWNAVDKLKKSGEDFLNGYFLSLKANAGIELEMLKDRFISG